MTLELQAIVPEDGWAFVRQGERVFLVRPPYQRAQIAEVSADSIERALSVHGFEASSRSFANWDDLIEYLRGEIVRAAEARPRMDDPARRLLRHAPRDVLENYLDRVATELIPSAKWDAAADLLRVMLALDIVIKDAALLRRTSELISQCIAAVGQQKKEREQLVTGASDLSRRFPRMAKQYGNALLREFVKVVRSQNDVLKMAG